MSAEPNPPAPRRRPAERLRRLPGLARPRLRRAGAWTSRHVGRVRVPRPNRKALAWTGGVVGVLALAIALFLILFDWNYLRGPIARYASARIHREVAIDGDLRVRLLSWEPSATVDRIRIGNPAWAGEKRMADIERLHVQIRAAPLLRGQVLMQRLELTRPNFALIRDRQGRANWNFSERDQDRPTRLPPIRRFVIDDGKLTLNDAKRRLTLDATVNATERMGATNRGFELSGRGSINANPFLLMVTGGPLLNIDPDKPYPFDADMRAGATHVTAKGAVPKPFDLGRFHMNTTASGPDLAQLYDLTGVTLPNTPPYRLRGFLSREDLLWRIRRIGGRVGDSDLSGDLSVDTAGDRPFLTADLKSRSLDFDDLAAVFGGAPKTGPGETASAEQKAVAGQLIAQQRILPDATLKVERIRAMDADVRYRADDVRDAMIPLRAASMHVKLKNGVLDANPVRFDLPQGRLDGNARLDASKATPVTAIDMRLSNARLEQLIPIRGGDQPLTGALVGRAKLTGEGNSVHRAASNADGEVVVVVPGGEIRQAFAELMGINVTKGLGLLLSKNQQKTEVRCAVAHFQTRDGVMVADRIVLDTGPVIATGSGTVNLETERMDIRLKGHPKEARLIRLMAPITLKGPIKSPKPGVEPGGAIAQGGLAALLASLASPLAAILPFVDLGLAEDANCGALIAEARREGVPVKSLARR